MMTFALGMLVGVLFGMLGIALSLAADPGYQRNANCKTCRHYDQKTTYCTEHKIVVKR